MPNYLLINGDDAASAISIGGPFSIGPGLAVEISHVKSSWDDLRFPAHSAKKGSSDKPDYDYTNNGLLFPQNDAAEKIYIVAQLQHHWKEGTDLHPHVHYVQDEADVPVFKMAYRWYKNGGDPTGAFTTITTADEGGGAVFTYTSGSILQILNFPLIDGSNIDTVSSIMDIILYREDDVVTGDVLFKEFDIHYEIDSLGSETEFIK